MRCFNSWVAKMAEILAGRTEQVCRDSRTTCSSVQRLLILTSLTVPGSTARICMADKSTVPIRLESRLVPSSGIGLQVCTWTYAAGLQTAPRLHATVLPRIRIRIRIRVKMCRVNATILLDYILPATFDSLFGADSRHLARCIFLSDCYNQILYAFRVNY